MTDWTQWNRKKGCRSFNIISSAFVDTLMQRQAILARTHKSDFKFIVKVESQTNNNNLKKNQFLLILYDFFLQKPKGSPVHMPNYSGIKLGD